MKVTFGVQIQDVERQTHPIIQCVIDKNLKKLKKLLKKCEINGQYPCAQWKDNVTPLCAAVACGDEEICTYLLSEDADPNFPSATALTPLMYAVKFNCSIHLVRLLLNKKANPNLGLAPNSTPFVQAACNNRKDIVRELLRHGAVPNLNYIPNPNSDKLISKMLHGLSSDGDQIKNYALFFDLPCEMQTKHPEDIFTQYQQHFLKVHPKMQYTVFDQVFGATGPSAPSYRQLAIKWLKDSQNLNTYVEATIQHFPTDATVQLYIVNNLFSAICLMDEIPVKFSYPLVPILLTCLKKTPIGLADSVLKLLHVIIQKTPKQKDGLDINFTTNLCKAIVPFTEPEYSADTGTLTYGIMAHLYLYEGLPEVITSLGVTSVPERILDAAYSRPDETLKRKLRELNEGLKRFSDRQSFDEELPTVTEEKRKKKKKKKKKKTKSNELVASSVMVTSDCDTPVNSVEETHSIEESSSVKPFPSDTDTLSQAMTIPRPWHKISDRWRPELEKLANMSISEVERVNNLIFSPDYLIAKGSDGTEVFLGLRDDGTEVAIKRMTRSNYQLLKNEEEFLRLPQLESPNIVHYVDFAEDKHFGYLVLQLCEYTLEEYINPENHHLPINYEEKMDVLKTKVKEVLLSLQVLHSNDTNVLHRDIKPQNVLIDIKGKARLADFGISRRLNVGQTTLVTRPAGTKCWKPSEAVEEESESGYKRRSDVQVAGMLAYYILSCGDHPFGKGSRCETNILDGKYSLDSVKDELAKDLIEWMIQAKPEDRPRVEQTLTHPYFWENDRRVEYLIKVGNEKEAENFRNPDKKLFEELEKYTVNKTFSDWRNKFPPELVQKLDEKQKKPYPENTLALLRFIRNLYEHHNADADMIDLMALFPDLFGSVYKFAKEKDWNSRSSLKKFFKE